MRVWLEKGTDDGEPAIIRMGTYIQIVVPYTGDRNPSDWWNVEAITAIHASRIANSWKGSLNEPLDDVVMMLATEVRDYNDDAFPTVEVMRSVVVRERFRRGWSPTRGSSDLMPCLFVGRAELIVQRARALLEDVHGGILFSTVGSSSLVGAVIRIVRGRTEYMKIETKDDAESLLLRTIRFAKPGTVPKGQPAPRVVPPTGSNPPPIVTRDLVTFVPEWPPLDGIVRMPTLRPDGSVVASSGYDPQTRLWLAPDEIFSSIKVPETPTWADVERARLTLWEPFSEFPWVDGPGGIMCALFEQFLIRILGDANRPLHVIDAPPHGQGSGKTFCAQVIGCIITGEVPAGSSRGSSGSDEELEKRVTSFLLKDTNYHLIDNVSHYVVSDSLALLTTSPKWSGRILGVSKSPDMPNKRTWVITLNGGRFSPDLIRRIILNRLNAKSSKAYQSREFRIKYIQEWTLANRGRLVEAILTIARAWVVAGTPTYPQLKKIRGGFERYLDVVGSVVMYAGFNGLVESLTVAEDRNIASSDDQVLLGAWRTVFGLQRVSASAVCALATERGLYEATFKPYKDSGSSWAVRAFARDILDRFASSGAIVVYGSSGDRYFSLRSE